MKTCLPACLCLLFAGAGTRGQPAFNEPFEDLSPWTVIASDGVRASLSAAEGSRGQALRLDFEFQTGAGFCVVRRPVDLALPENYRFAFLIRGEAPRNNFEFKLVDPSGENVWWVNRRDFEFPAEWQEISYKARHLRFAWGPAGDRPLEKVGFIEFAVAAGSGGRGWLLIDELSFEPLRAVSVAAPTVRTSSGRYRDGRERFALDAVGRLDWASDPSDAAAWLELAFDSAADVGGLIVEWSGPDYATRYELTAAAGDGAARRVFGVGDGNGRRDYLPVAIDVGGKRLRLVILETSRGRGAAIKSVRIMPPEFGEQPNAMLKTVAQDAPRGHFPEFFRDRQVHWTVVGAAGDEHEALLDSFGAIELEKLGARLEPFLSVDGKLLTWADAAVSQRLAEDYLPIPTVVWRAGGFELEITAFADGSPGASFLTAVYRIRHSAEEPRTASLVLAVRPFQVLPPWQELNITGGVSRVETIRVEPGQSGADRVIINGRKHLLLASRPAAFGATAFASGEIVEWLGEGRLPPHDDVNDPQRLASAGLRYDFDLPPGESRTVVVVSPFGDAGPESTRDASEREIESRMAAVSADWAKQLNRVGLTLPASGKALADAFRTAQAHILINADGPAIQPGSRTYERSWVRDGALTSAALLATGHTEQVRAFLDWYAAYQFPDGKVPCVVDRRGPDPVPEHDSTGEFIFALYNYYRFTKDRALLERHWPRVVAGVEYLQRLRAERMTDAYRDGPPEKRAYYGLVPESISHEGYSAKPMHSYWDNFFTLRGFKDAAAIAELLGQQEAAARYAALRDEFRTALYDSVRLAMRLHDIDYIPGCVELGDFDATSTTIAIFPCAELGFAPEPPLTRTFERYLAFFRERRDGGGWENYTPYEWRTVGSFVRLGRRDAALELLEFFMGHRTPPGWNQWPEVVWRDPGAPRFVGDIPHTWVGSDFLSAARSLFVYEREQDEALVVAAGVHEGWLREEGGVRVRDFPTWYGPLSYCLTRREGHTLLQLDGRFETMPARIVLRSPHRRPIRAVEVNGQPYSAFNEHEVMLRDGKSDVIVRYEP